ncbi:MAG: helix-turn-helix transcriptional regulator [Dysgonamonadaceae bacterium]
MERTINGKKINRDKLNKLSTAHEFFDNKYGKIGSEERDKFELDTLLLALGELLRESRIKLDLTQKELADKTGLKREYITKIEKGQTDIRLSNLIKLSIGLHLDKINLNELKILNKDKTLV